MSFHSTAPAVKGTSKWNREHVMQMGKLQNDTWGLGYIDLYLIHFPVALEYIEPSKLQYPVRAIDLHGLENYC